MRQIGRRTDHPQGCGGPDGHVSAGIAGRDRNLLFVDTRPGPLHGRVTEFDKVGAGEACPRWLCIGAMFTDLAKSLYTGSVHDRWTPTVTVGQLS